MPTRPSILRVLPPMYRSLQSITHGLINKYWIYNIFSTVNRSYDWQWSHERTNLVVYNILLYSDIKWSSIMINYCTIRTIFNVYRRVTTFWWNINCLKYLQTYVLHAIEYGGFVTSPSHIVFHIWKARKSPDLWQTIFSSCASLQIIFYLMLIFSWTMWIIANQFVMLVTYN